MPHSIASEGSNASHKDDEVLPDAPPAADSPNPGENSGDGTEKATTGVKLEDLFDEEEDDDNEFPASNAPAETKNESTE